MGHRIGAIRQLRWSEIDAMDGVWKVSASRMQMKREHGVPLYGPGAGASRRGANAGRSCRSCVNGSGRTGSRPVPHRLRSSLRDWTAEETDHPRDIVEAALAHVVQKKPERRRRWMGGRSIGCAGARAPRRDLDVLPPLRKAQRPLSGLSGGVSGTLRAAGSPRIDDRRSPRGRDRAKSGGRKRAPLSSGR